MVNVKFRVTVIPTRAFVLVPIAFLFPQYSVKYTVFTMSLMRVR